MFSSLDLAVDAIGVSAGVDLDLTLEDLMRILDAYKHTSPTIKIGITKAVQSIGMSLPSIASSPSPSLHPPLSLSSALPPPLFSLFVLDLYVLYATIPIGSG